MIALAILGLLLAISPVASAQIVVGQTAPGVSPSLNCDYSDPYDELQNSVASGASYTVPTAGVLTSWSTNAGAGGGQTLGLKIFRPLGPGVFQIVAHDGPRPLAPNVLNTFGINIPVLPGDILGISNTPGEPEFGGVPTACSFFTEIPADTISYREGHAPDGAAFSPESSFVGNRLNVSATLLPPPAISAVTPAKGSIKGDTSVVIAGVNFAGVSAVSFGTTPAKSFTVNSEGQITAISPASATIAKVPISITTVAGATTSVQTYAYEGCKVPGLGGKKLKAAKKTLKNKGCKPGKVKKTNGVTSKTGKVTKQNPKPGKLLAPGTKVNVTLG
ncbi:MAG TPA: PASTA domain-containing protein [Solirubrobacterales bacterium]|nr:PASTA domain-containing protein [Solirubrobacterales bacterium]